MTGPFGTTAGPWECNDYGGDYDGARFGEVAYLLDCPKVGFEATAANARAIAQVPAMLELISCIKNTKGAVGEKARWIRMAHSIIKNLEEK